MARALLLSCEAVSKAFGTRSLFEELSFGLFEGDQVGLGEEGPAVAREPPEAASRRLAPRESGDSSRRAVTEGDGDWAPPEVEGLGHPLLDAAIVSPGISPRVERREPTCS